MLRTLQSGSDVINLTNETQREHELHRIIADVFERNGIFDEHELISDPVFSKKSRLKSLIGSRCISSGCLTSRA